eukprot:7562010-Alexandrium_andersonii.AAC.1
MGARLQGLLGCLDAHDPTRQLSLLISELVNAPRELRNLGPRRRSEVHPPATKPWGQRPGPGTGQASPLRRDPA